LCVNPDHIYAGTPLDNVNDSLSRGQFPRGPNKSKGSPGERNFNSKLTEDQVRVIRDSNLSTRCLADAYGVNKVTIRYVQMRKTWKHI
jgi:hypothetical protein